MKNFLISLISLAFTLVYADMIANPIAPQQLSFLEQKNDDLSTLDLSWSFCGNYSEDLLDITSLTYSPVVPVRGEPFTVKLKGRLRGEISEGSKVNLLVKWGFVRIPVPPVDVCKELINVPDSPYKCPIRADHLDLTQTFLFPTQVPDGNYDVTIRVKNQDSRQITCIKVNLTME